MAVVAEEAVDDVTLGLQMQQFLDEWHYRVLHSGLAYNTDRHSCVKTALQLLEMHGLIIDDQEKSELVKQEEPVMIEELVKKMSPDMRKSFEHFALQLQLVVSATTRVRYALDEVTAATGTPEEETQKAEVARVMDEGDTGISQQILRQTVYEAAIEVGELNELHSSWFKNMAERVSRLGRAADDAEKAKSQLAAVNAELDSFGNDQNKKAKGVLLTMCASTDRSLMESTYRAWMGHFIKYQAEKEIHEKFRKQIDDAQLKLLQYKAANKSGVSNVLMRKATEGDKFLKTEVFNTWTKYVAESKEEAGLAEQMAQAKAKLGKFHETQQANTKKVMMRMTAGQDGQMKTITFQAWQKGIADIKAENAMDEATKKAEAALAEHMAKKSAEAKQVISRMLGSGEQGLLFMIRGAWNELYKVEKKQMEMDEAVQNAQKKFSQMSAKQKRCVKNCAERCNMLEQELGVGFVFQQWATQAKVDRVQRHYSGKMDMKKNQLEAVQQMFKSFATQLESGISTTPRSQRKSNRSSSQGRQTQVADAQGARPPQMPQGQ